MSETVTPIDVPLIDRSKEELVAIIGRLKENLSWYVEERNRLIAEIGNDGI